MYELVAIAGTFDRLHKGHRFFISQAFSLGERVLIGLTSDSFVEKKFQISNSPAARGIPTSRRDKFQTKSKIQIQNFQTRKRDLIDFLKSKELLKKAEIVTIDDVYGPAILKSEIEALMVTSDTLEGGRKVNRKRRELGLPPLKLVKIPLVAAEDYRRIASTRIRLGEIDRYGKVYLSKIKNQKSKIKSEVRQRLKKPLGVLIEGDPENLKAILPELRSSIKRLKPVMLITVGDEVTKLSHENGLFPELSVFDYKVGRKTIYKHHSDLGITSGKIVSVRNPPGYVTKSLVTEVKKAIKSYISYGGRHLLRVIGEEDLAGIPTIVLAPLGSLIIYGQPGEGVVAVEVTEEKKNQLIKYINNCIPGRESNY